MNEDQENRLLNDWLEGKAEDEELRTKLSDETLLKYKQILETVDQLVPDNDPMVFDPREITSQPKTIERKLDWFRTLSVAASIVLVIAVGLFYFTRSDKTEYETLANEHKTIILPDNSTTVELASNSKLIFEKGDWNNGVRKVTLEGQAYFDVTEKGDFEVQTSLGKVSVLGTQFNVNQTEDIFLVNCYEGKVRAESGSSSIELNKGEMTRWLGEDWEPATEEKKLKPSWLIDLMTFKNAPLKEVISLLSKEYLITINADAIDLDRRFTGTVPDDNLDAALQIVFDPLDIQYKLEGKRLILSE